MKSTSKHVKLIKSDEKSPKISIKPGQVLEVVGVSLIDPTLKKSKATAARLCGGTSTCVALIELRQDSK